MEKAAQHQTLGRSRPRPAVARRGPAPLPRAKSRSTAPANPRGESAAASRGRALRRRRSDPSRGSENPGNPVRSRHGARDTAAARRPRRMRISIRAPATRGARGSGEEAPEGQQQVVDEDQSCGDQHSRTARRRVRRSLSGTRPAKRSGARGGRGGGGADLVLFLRLDPHLGGRLFPGCSRSDRAPRGSSWWSFQRPDL
jgi:hypothetical protein